MHGKAASKTVDRRVRGQNVKFQAPSTQAASTSVFKSSTTRSLTTEINRAKKLNTPGAGTYGENRHLGLNLFQGGAPNNFLLTKN